jgi:hypothetical protein
MFKNITMLAGAALGVAAAVAMGAPSPQALISQVSGQQVFGQTASCAGHWGTGAKTSTRPGGPSTARAADVRVGAHACFDRLVIDLGTGAKPGYQVRYVRAVHAQGSGRLVPLRGRAQLEITVADNAAAGFPGSGSEIADVAGFRAFRQLAGAGSFEGSTELGLGVRTRLPFRVHVRNGPGNDSRLVIDVAHHR